MVKVGGGGESMNQKNKECSKKRKSKQEWVNCPSCGGSGFQKNTNGELVHCSTCQGMGGRWK